MTFLANNAGRTLRYMIVCGTAMGAVAVSADPVAGQAQSVPSSPPSSVGGPVAGTPLWQGLTYRMPIDEVARVLRTIAGVKSAEVVRKNGKPARVAIQYTPEGISIMQAQNVIDLTFDQDQLTQVQLTSKECLSTVKTKYPSYVEMLASKYGPGNQQREVTPSHELVAVRETYSDKVTRIIMRLFTENPAAVQPSVPGSGTIGKIGDILGAFTSNAAVNACPETQGVLGVLEISYSSDAAFRAAEDEARRANERAKEEGKSKL